MSPTCGCYCVGEFIHVGEPWVPKVYKSMPMLLHFYFYIHVFFAWAPYSLDLEWSREATIAIVYALCQGRNPSPLVGREERGWGTRSV